MPQLDVSTYTSQLFWLLISWGILFIFLWKVIVPKMSGKLSKREAKIKELLVEAQHLNAQAESIILEYNQKLNEVKHIQKEKLQNVCNFIQKSKEDLEMSLAKDTEKLLEKYQVSLETSTKELLQRLPESLESSLITLINQHLPTAMEDTHQVKQLLIKEIKKSSAL